MNPAIYTLTAQQNPESGLTEAVLTYTRFETVQSIRMLRRDWDDQVIDHLIHWATTFRADLKAHPSFEKLKAAIDSVA